MTESRHPLPDLPGVALTLRRSARARRFSLRVSRVDGQVTLTLPLRAREAEALAFAHSQTDWLRRALDRVPQVSRPVFGATLPFEGRDLVLTPAAVRAPRVTGAQLLLPPEPERIGARLEAFLKHCARIRLQAATERHAGTLGRPFRKITLRDTRSRWGSCAQDGSLSYSWRLIMAPPSVLDYVAAHEVAHLAEMNHSPAFWTVVARLRPDYAPDRAWLKQHGGALHALRFRD
ncbi:M48 family metallopeptidase [Paenirhodobacter sp.]|uniref:M48 family metallopeptidase n=1 Tax=Paenirhodobacter sp. TaxID=1965326 RepID=UPI003B3F565A